MIRYTEGDATSPEATGQVILVQCNNDIPAWGRGFVLAVSEKWPFTRDEYLAWGKGQRSQYGPFELGAVQFLRVTPNLLLANLIGQHGIKAQGGRPPIRYDAIERGLSRVAEYAKELGAEVHMPRIGAGLAGGRWEEIEAILERTLGAAGIPVVVYDFKNTQSRSFVSDEEVRRRMGR